MPRIQVVGYGTLLSEASARRTAPSVDRFRVVRVPGWIRIFNKAIGKGGEDLDDIPKLVEMEGSALKADISTSLSQIKKQARQYGSYLWCAKCAVGRCSWRTSRCSPFCRTGSASPSRRRQKLSRPPTTMTRRPFGVTGVTLTALRGRQIACLK